MRFDDIDQAIKRSDLVTWAGQNTDATVTLTAMDMAYIGSILALFQANAWLSNEPDETLTVSEIDHAMWSLCNVLGETMKIAIVTDEKPANTPNGAFNTGAWRLRDLNTENDPDGLITLANNTITIATAGKYYLRVATVFWSSGITGLRLLKGGVAFAYGLSGYSVSGTQGVIHLVGLANLTIGDTLTLEIQCSQTKTVDGLGTPNYYGPGIFSIVELWKLDG